jgi:hypothetical protein
MKKKLCMIDAQNLWYTPKTNWNMKVDYKKLSVMIKRNCVQDVDLYIYLVLDPLVSSDSFINLLKSVGYKPQLKFIHQTDGTRFGNTDSCADMIADGKRIIRSGDYDSVSIVSGNSVFQDLFRYAKAMGCATEMCCFKEDYSEKSWKSVDKAFFLEKNICF